MQRDTGEQIVAVPVPQIREETGQVIQRIPQDRIVDRNGKGIILSDKTEDCLTNPRFADDVLLFSASLERLREMLVKSEKRSKSASGTTKERKGKTKYKKFWKKSRVQRTLPVLNHSRTESSFPKSKTKKARL